MDAYLLRHRAVVASLFSQTGRLIKTLLKISAKLSIEKITFTTFCELFQLMGDKRSRGGPNRLYRFGL